MNISIHSLALKYEDIKKIEIIHVEDGKDRQNSGIIRNIWYG